MFFADWTDISVFPRRLKAALLLFAFAAGLSGVGGCVGHTPSARKGKGIKPASSVSRSKADQAVDSAESDSDKSAPEITGEKETADYSCSYFQFLRGRHAELAAEYEEALACYEKSLRCDRDADFVFRKIPLLLLHLNRSDEAVSRLKKYLTDHPEDTMSRLLLAKIFIRQDEFEKAARQYREIHGLHPDETGSQILLAELYLAENKTDKAESVLRDILTANDDSYPAHLLLARLLIAEEDFAAGRRHYQQALDLLWSEELQMELAEVLIRQKKYARAVEMYQEILQHDELNEEVRISLVQLYLLQGKEKKAMAELRRLKKNTQHLEQVELGVVRLYIRWEKYDRAIRLLEKLLQRKELSGARYLLAVLRFQEKQYDVALRDLKKIGPDAGEYEDAVFLQVRTLQELERHKEAVRLLESAVAEEEGRTPDLYVLLAGIYEFLGWQERGRKTFLRALKVYPENEEVLYEYGLFLHHIGEQPQALEIMQRIIAVQPEHAGALNYVGYMWATKKMHLDKALQYISRAAQLKPKNGYIQDSLGWVYYQQGKFIRAVKALEQALELSPDAPMILDHLADAYLAAGQTEKALAIWRRALELYRQNTDENGKGDSSRKEEKSKIGQLEKIEKKMRGLEQKEKK
ncbi:MAG: tetratricopeptide repeat protein [Candidatus Electrothrix sp. YB6]